MDQSTYASLERRLDAIDATIDRIEAKMAILAERFGARRAASGPGRSLQQPPAS